MPNTGPQIRVGDMVRLKSGGPEMRVHEVRRGAARCTWRQHDSAQFGYCLLPLLVVSIWCGTRPESDRVSSAPTPLRAMLAPPHLPA